MWEGPTGRAVISRLKRVEGQIAAIRRMVEAEEPCVDVLLQIAAARGALSKAGQIVLSTHIETCVGEAFRQGNEEARRRKIDELIRVFSRYGGSAAR